MTTICLPEKDLKDIASKVGLSVVGYTTLDPLAEDQARLAEWQARRFMGSMAYMGRSPSLLGAPSESLTPSLSTSPQGTIVSVAVFYERTPHPALKSGYGRVARYAWGKDYHSVLRARLEQFAAAIQSHIGPPLVQARTFTDNFPLLERAIAKRSGLGFIGKNTLLITPGSGSFSLLGEVYLGLTVHPRSPLAQIAKDRCGQCRLCISSCPTGALVEDRVLDARRCISYLTIEKRGILSEWERGAIGEWLFGCDVCQDVCPFNARSLISRRESEIDELSAAHGVGKQLNLLELLSIRDDQRFRERFRGTPLVRPKREGLLRNAIAVVVNTKSVELGSELVDILTSDSSSVLRAMASWGLAKLADISGENFKPELERAALGDPEELVRNEATKGLRQLCGEC